MGTNEAKTTRMNLASVVRRHERWVDFVAEEKAFFSQLASEPQRPRALWIGCSDSRVQPNTIFDAKPGEIFIVRNIANTVPAAGSGEGSVGAVLEFGLAHLMIGDVVVCGHSGCGGIQALLDDAEPPKEPHLRRWLEMTRPAHDAVNARNVCAEDRLLEAIKAHILFQLENLLTYDTVAERVRDGRVRLHGWLYDIEHGGLLAYDAGDEEWRPVADLVERKWEETPPTS